MSPQVVIQVSDSSQVGEARRCVMRSAELAGFNETDSGKVAIIATEMANNLVRHASEGELLIQVIETSFGNSVEILSIDSGPGIADVERCLQDGYSTGGTPGNGLGAIRRLSSEFDIFSVPSVGTVIVSRVHGQQTQSTRELFVIGGISIPLAGETDCGDAWRASQSGNVLRLMVADGLGHGPLAKEASDAAVQVFNTQPDADPASLIELANRALGGTRGAAIAVALLDSQTGLLKYSGVGNIAGLLVTDESQQGLVSNNGIVGTHRRKGQQFDYVCAGNGLLIMNSDGLRSHLSLNNYPGLPMRHPAVIAGVLYRDCRRGRDDATVVVVRLVLPGRDAYGRIDLPAASRKRSTSGTGAVSSRRISRNEHGRSGAVR